jgi:hypothetical protein
MKISRRALMGAIAFAPVGFATARAESGSGRCYDPAALPMSQRSMRRALGFQERATNPARTCSKCSFFTAANDDCGTCQLLRGGPTTPGSSCNSWAPAG